MSNRSAPSNSPPTPPTDAESSMALLKRARAGDRQALEALTARYLPRLRRWASGRLPRWARDLADTEDLVQETVLQTFKRIDEIGLFRSLQWATPHF